VDGFIRNCIDVHNKANKYGTPKEFNTKKDAEKWIEIHSYKGMSFHYEIIKASQ
jgi:hypothetical protein